MDGGLTAALLIGATTAAISAKQAQEQNKANARSAKSIRDAQAVAEGQGAGVASMERYKRQNEANAIIARLAVAGAERGVGTGGTAAAIAASEAYNATIDNAITNRNAEYRAARVASEAEANITSVMSRNVNPLLAAFTGGLNGITAGLSIGGAIQSLRGTTTTEPLRPQRSVEGGNAGAPYGSAYA